MTTKSLLNINKNILKEYKDIEVLNQDNWDISSYLNLKYDMNTALAFSKLYFPDFVEKNGCIILHFRYDEETFNQWYEHFGGEIPDIERMCNQYEIMDYFHNNRPNNESLDYYNQLIDEFSKALKRSWEINCQLLFPDKKIVVEVYDEYDTTHITLFQVK